MLLRVLLSRARIISSTEAAFASECARVFVFLSPQFGGQAYSDVEHTAVQCRALDGIECAGPRTFLRENKPCIK